MPVVVEVSNNVDLTNAKVRFSYSAADPANVTRSGSGSADDPYGYNKGGGALRLWMKDGVVARKKASVAEVNAANRGDFVPSGVEIPAAAITKLKDYCTFSVGEVGSSIKEWNSENEAGVPTVAGDKLKATVTFSELPADNSAFGLKVAKLTCTVNGKYEIKNNYEVFFPATKTNHPACSVCADCPNWFYYWRQVYSGGNVIYSAASGVGETVGMTNWSYGNSPNKTLIKIGNAHPSEYQSYGIGKKCSGIDRLIMTIIHERKHVEQISRADALLPTNGSDSFRYGWSWNMSTHNHWTKGPDDKWGVAGVDDNGNGTVDEAAALPPFELGYGDDVNLGYATTDKIWWPLTWTLPGGIYATIHPIEGEAVKAADDAMNENDYARSDWGSPGKNHKTLDKFND